ncbi:flavin reductase family protein [Alteromonas lipolytica]|uniref:Asp/Glu/hydantoin racemase n=1 Tax=Alteromonas lipolytica TaxID=1856405 RepID=A0A1E8FCG9_9ALTE|nr:flavin reductase family protein [Alteromonas lipolytica]OFI33611.1 Asp/Glu/hydantoin racemase [Alteromonas lipolytica]GGF59941.1 Asp/Glu/hydantoin racemase [Alteromonas lipolytica]
MSAPFYSYQPAKGHGLPHDPFKAIIAPRPIGWIASQSESGIANLAPYSFFNAFNGAPPIIGFASVGFKDSVRNIQATGEFCWSLATRELALPMNQSSASVDASIDEFELAGLEKRASTLVSVPHVAASPASMECKVTQIIQLNDMHGQQCDTWLVLGQVVAVHIQQAFLTDGVFDTAGAASIMRAGGLGDYFSVSEDAKFIMGRP